jgi:hypothetical protein
MSWKTTRINGYSLINNSYDWNMTIGYYLGFYSSSRDQNSANGDLYKIMFKFNEFRAFSMRPFKIDI